jgi:hypothetical protein
MRISETHARTIPGMLCSEHASTTNPKSSRRRCRWRVQENNRQQIAMLAFRCSPDGARPHQPTSSTARRSRSNFDEAVDSKPDKRNTAGDYTCGDSDYAFDGIPHNREKFKPAPTAHRGRTIENERLGHVPSLQCRRTEAGSLDFPAGLRPMRIAGVQLGSQKGHFRPGFG